MGIMGRDEEKLMSIMGRGGIQDSQEKEPQELPASEAPSGNGRNERPNPQAILGNTIIIRQRPQVRVCDGVYRCRRLHDGSSSTEWTE